jgi:oligopeptide/dipeptide ABC transporter ATP-binding protein
LFTAVFLSPAPKPGITCIFMSAPDHLVDVRHLAIHFGSPDRPLPAVQDVSFYIARGESVGLVGESGCGKSLTALSLAGLIPRPPARLAGGSICFDGCELATLPESSWRAWRGRRIAYVFQEPAAALNPVLSIGAQVMEVLRLHRPDAAVGSEVDRLLGLVELRDPARVRRSYPHQLSGGMQQRAVLAMALAGQPDLLVADEPTTALDVTVQAQIMTLLRTLQRELGMALLLITHNLGLVAQVTRRLYVMYAGRMVEQGLTLEVLRHPAHPYTQALLRAVPRLRGSGTVLQGIPGTVPQARDWPTGCLFHPRCARRQARCVTDDPGWDEAGAGHEVRCHFWT